MNEKIRQILIRQSETREALNGLADDAPDTDRAALVAKAQAIEKELREALAEPEPDPGDDQGDGGPAAIDAEERERREIRSRATVAGYLTAALRRQGVTGAEAEYADACGCPGQMPVGMLFDRPAETRAAATVAAAAVAETPMPTAGQVFVSPLASALGIMTPTVPAGTAAFPYVSTGVSPATVAAGSAVADSSPAISAHTADQRRVSASFQFQAEDAAKLADLESTLRENLSAALAHAFDSQIVSGDNNSPNLHGLLAQKPATAPGDNVVTTFATLIDAVKDFVDGTYAEDFGQVRLVTSPTVANFLTGLLRSATDPTSALEWLRKTYPGGFRISKQAPVIAPVNHGTSGNRRAGGGGLWAVRTRVAALAYAPIWMGMDVITDPYTEAKKATTIVTAHMIVGGVAIVRPDAYTVATVRTAQGAAA